MTVKPKLQQTGTLTLWPGEVDVFSRGRVYAWAGRGLSSGQPDEHCRLWLVQPDWNLQVPGVVLSKPRFVLPPVGRHASLCSLTWHCLGLTGKPWGKDEEEELEFLFSWARHCLWLFLEGL